MANTTEIPHVAPNSIRLISFNVNGVKTLKNYFPFNEHSNYSESLSFMKGDIIAFQELKLQRMDIDRSIADLEGYRSFITVPVSRKGYSGVGVFIRKANENDQDLVKKTLTVIKVEEGITGVLNLKPSKKSYRESFKEPLYKDMCIGGYPLLSDPDLCKKIDGEGRCILVELNFGLVVISVYCPANSMRTEEGEEFRITFLRCLFERADNLAKLGKHVVIMGDINVSPDLIDNDETIRESLHDKVLTWDEDPIKFEELNKEQVINFKSSTEARTLLNDYVFDTTGFKSNEDKLLHDVIREVNGRKLKMYTVWNTLLNSRPLNIGSRIDLILTTDTLAQSTKVADSWPFLYGSDHCPVFCDIDIQNVSSSSSTDLYEKFKSKTNHFDASRFYNLHVGKGIEFFFGKKQKQIKTAKPKSVESSGIKKRPSEKPVYISRKKQAVDQKTISKFFSSSSSQSIGVIENVTEIRNSDSLFVPDDYSSDDEEIQIVAKKTISCKDFKNILHSKFSSGAPYCKHNEECVLRVVKRDDSFHKGRKFWSCPRNSRRDTWEVSQKPIEKELEESEDLDEFSCGFFKWASK